MKDGKNKKRWPNTNKIPFFKKLNYTVDGYEKALR